MSQSGRRGRDLRARAGRSMILDSSAIIAILAREAFPDQRPSPSLGGRVTVLTNPGQLDANIGFESIDQLPGRRVRDI